MKKNVWCIALTLALLLTLAACGNTHTHAAQGGWEVDSAEHWMLCECGEKVDAGEHTLDDMWVCTVCGAEVLEWDDSTDVWQYDEYGNMLRSASYDREGSLLSETRYEYTYDEEGNILTEKGYVDGTLSSECTYENGLTTTYTGYLEDGTWSFSEYDEKGNPTSTITYDAAGAVISESYSEYTYDADGYIYEETDTLIDADGSKYVGVYNERGDQIVWITYDPDGNVENNERYEYTYTEDGETETVKTYSNDILVEEKIYTMVTYDDGWMNYPSTIIEYCEDGAKTVCEYDENNELLSETNYDADGNVIVME